MRGVLLAGGNGSRLRPATEVYPKCLAVVYDKPMLHYPLKTLAEMGCTDVVVVASPDGTGAISKAFKDGTEYEMDLTYRVQREPNGVGGALIRAEGFVEGVFPLMLSDMYHDPAPRPYHWDRPTMFWKDYEFANEHSVWSPEADAIIEKPRHIDLGKRAIIGYCYDERVFDFIKQMQPAHNTHELEIVDIHNYYRNLAEMVEYTGFFADLGTPDGLLRGAIHAQHEN